MEKIRVFIAIELPEQVKSTLTRLQNRLKSKSDAPVKWTDPAGTHLTLQFLGYVDPAITGQITAAMAEAARGKHKFHLTCGGLGVFPNPQRVRVVWVGLTGDLEQLNQLQKSLEAALLPLGFKPEDRPFTAHLTLGRVRDNARPEERQTLGRLAAGGSSEAETGFEVKSIHLVQSQLRPQGAVYTIIGSVELK